MRAGLRVVLVSGGGAVSPLLRAVLLLAYKLVRCRPSVYEPLFVCRLLNKLEALWEALGV